MKATCSAQLLDAVRDFFADKHPNSIGVAVSGGSDSLALLTMLADWREAGGPSIQAATVDHGLRVESASEAEQVAQLCKSLGIPHETLHWDGWDGQGNLPDQARRARYALLRDWACKNQIECIALGHTANDQAETFLMRLSRESGLDGLSAMTAWWERDEVTFCRPLLAQTRETLRAFLIDREIAWVDDPTNEDERFDRPRARKALAALSSLGIEVETLAAVSRKLADTRNTLYRATAEAAEALTEVSGGDLLIDRASFAALDREIARRFLQRALQWVSGAEYAPRGAAMDRLLDAFLEGHTQTLHGVLLSFQSSHARLGRELRAVSGLTAEPGEAWDGRWRLTGPREQDDVVGVLGEAGLGLCPDRQDTGLPAASLRASPAVWRGEALIAAPLAGFSNGWHATLLRDKNQLITALLTH